MTPSADVHEGDLPRRVAIAPGSLSGGGIGRVMQVLANTAVEMGVDVDLLLTSPRDRTSDRVVDPRVRTVRLAHRTRSALPATIRYLRSERPQLLISAHANVNATMVAARCLARVPTRVVCTLHTHRSTELAHTSLRGRAYDAVARTTYRFADHVVAVSHGVASDHRESTGFRGPIDVIYNPAWDEESERRTAQPLDDPDLANRPRPWIVTAGRMTAQKDHATLLRAFGRIVPEVGGTLVLLGDGPERAATLTLAKELGLDDRIYAPGFVDSPLPYFRASDVFVLSSRWEGLPTVLVEALGAGARIVSTDCPSGPREILVGGEYGTLAPVGDAAALGRSILDTLSTPHDPNAAKRRAREFGPESATRAYLKLGAS